MSANQQLSWIRGRRSSGFTLIELLVVIGIIAILAGMLLQSLSKGKERARRKACVNNLKQLTLGVIMYSDDHEGWFQPHGNISPYWDSMPRSSFYCPSNKNWGSDRNDKSRDWPEGRPTVLGYVYYAGNEDYNSDLSRYPDRDLFKGTRIFAMKNTDNPHYKVLWTDTNRKFKGEWNHPEDRDPVMRGVNHFNQQDDAPDGSNEGYLDGHVAWADGNKFIHRHKITIKGAQHHFYGEADEEIGLPRP